MSEQKHNDPWGVSGGRRLEEMLSGLDAIPNQEPLDKSGAWNTLYGRLGGKGYQNRYFLYWIAAACLLLAMIAGGGMLVLQKQRNGPVPVNGHSGDPAVGREAATREAVTRAGVVDEAPVHEADTRETGARKIGSVLAPAGGIAVRETTGDETSSVGKEKGGGRRSVGGLGQRQVRRRSSAGPFVKKAETGTAFSQGIVPTLLPGQAGALRAGGDRESRKALPVMALNEIPFGNDGLSANDTIQHSFKKKIYNPGKLFLPALASEDPPMDPVIKIKLSSQN